jgi:hypothetical protein
MARDAKKSRRGVGAGETVVALRADSQRAPILQVLKAGPRTKAEIVRGLSDSFEGVGVTGNELEMRLLKLQNRGFITLEERRSVIRYALTESGRAFVETGSRGTEPRMGMGPPTRDLPGSLRDSMRSLREAVLRVGQENRPELVADAAAIVDDAARKMRELAGRPRPNP